MTPAITFNFVQQIHFVRLNEIISENIYEGKEYSKVFHPPLDNNQLKEISV